MYSSLGACEWREGEYALAPMRRDDILDVIRWRNEQLDILRQHAEISDAEQLRYYDAVVVPTFTASRPRLMLFSFLQGDRCIGYGGLTNIDWDAGRAELSYIAATERARDHDLYQREFAVFLRLLRRVAFGELELNRLFAETYDLRPHHVAVLEREGWMFEGRMRQHVVKSGRRIDSLLHGILRPAKP